MILDIGAPISIDCVPWIEQYLEEFDLKIQDLKAVKCHQIFMFGPSWRYVSEFLVELLSCLCDKTRWQRGCLSNPNIHC